DRSPGAGKRQVGASVGIRVKVLGVSGSLQGGSANTALLHVAQAVAPDSVEVVVFDGLAEIPPFNPETDPAPAAVEAFRSLGEAADGALFATPRSAHVLPGSLKNLLDWIVGSGEFYDKPVVVMSAARRSERGLHARAEPERTLAARGR